MLAPGYFTALIRQHNWPPMFESRIDDDAACALRGAAAIAIRDRQAANGIGWGDGTQPMPNTPHHPRPAWMLRHPGGGRS